MPPMQQERPLASMYQLQLHNSESLFVQWDPSVNYKYAHRLQESPFHIQETTCSVVEWHVPLQVQRPSSEAHRTFEERTEPDHS